jgi:hypothetical protein
MILAGGVMNREAARPFNFLGSSRAFLQKELFIVFYFMLFGPISPDHSNDFTHSM